MIFIQTYPKDFLLSCLNIQMKLEILLKVRHMLFIKQLVKEEITDNMILCN